MYGGVGSGGDFRPAGRAVAIHLNYCGGPITCPACSMPSTYRCPRWCGRLDRDPANLGHSLGLAVRCHSRRSPPSAVAYDRLLAEAGLGVDGASGCRCRSKRMTCFLAATPRHELRTSMPTVEMIGAPIGVAPSSTVAVDTPRTDRT